MVILKWIFYSAQVFENFKDFSEARSCSKNSEKKSGLFLVRKCTTVNFFRFFGANFRVEKKSIKYVFEVRK